MSGINSSIKGSWLNGRLNLEIASDGSELCRGFYPSGEPHFVYPKRNDAFHGICVVWHKNGTILSLEHYQNGMRQGVSHEYHPDGSVASKTTYLNDLKQGEHLTWYPDGKLATHYKYQNGQQHGPQISWANNGDLTFQEFRIRSIRVSKELWQNLENETLTAQMICAVENVTLRRACLEELGYARFLSQMRYRTIQKKGDEALIRISKWHKDEENITLVKVRCPSTGAFYALRVPPGMKTIKAAVAWTFGLDEMNYRPEKET